jgi:hypothetical protein
MLDELEQRVARLEATTLRDAGVWQEGRRYRANDCVTYRGTLWVAKTDTEAKPFSCSWRMLAKPTRSR